MELLLTVAQVHEDERKAVQQALRSLGEQLTAANLSREQEVADYTTCAWDCECPV